MARAVVSPLGGPCARAPPAGASAPRAGSAARGSLEEFLVERYRLYSRAVGPLLWTGPVVHEPWPLFQATVAELSEDLSVAAGLRPLGRPSRCHWSPGVSVAFEHFRPA